MFRTADDGKSHSVLGRFLRQIFRIPLLGDALFGPNVMRWLRSTEKAALLGGHTDNEPFFLAVFLFVFGIPSNRDRALRVLW